MLVLIHLLAEQVGAQAYGRDGWGDATSNGLTTTNQIRLWSHDNFGEDLIINARDSEHLLLG